MKVIKRCKSWFQIRCLSHKHYFALHHVVCNGPLDIVIQYVTSENVTVLSREGDTLLTGFLKEVYKSLYNSVYTGEIHFFEGDHFYYLKIVEYLIQIGVDVDKGCNTNGETALHLAASNFDSAVVQLLLDSGANYLLLNDDGELPLFKTLVRCNFVKNTYPIPGCTGLVDFGVVDRHEHIFSCIFMLISLIWDLPTAVENNIRQELSKLLSIPRDHLIINRIIHYSSALYGSLLTRNNKSGVSVMQLMADLQFNHRDVLDFFDFHLDPFQYIKEHKHIQTDGYMETIENGNIENIFYI